MCTSTFRGLTETFPCVTPEPYEAYKAELLYPWHWWGIGAIWLAMAAVLIWIYASRGRPRGERTR